MAGAEKKNMQAVNRAICTPGHARMLLPCIITSPSRGLAGEKRSCPHPRLLIGLPAAGVCQAAGAPIGSLVVGRAVMKAEGGEEEEEGN